MQLHDEGSRESLLKASQKFGEALQLDYSLNDISSEAIALNNIGFLYDSLGEKQKALDYYGRALSLRRAVGDRSGEAAALNNIGLVYDSLGEKQKVLDYFGYFVVPPAIGAVKPSRSPTLARSMISTVIECLANSELGFSKAADPKKCGARCRKFRRLSGLCRTIHHSPRHKTGGKFAVPWLCELNRPEY